MYNNIPKYENIQLVTALAASPRFRNIRILDYKDIYDNNLILQFSAMTFEMNDGFWLLFAERIRLLRAGKRTFA